jgi:hypothetical protein
MFRLVTQNWLSAPAGALARSAGSRVSPHPMRSGALQRPPLVGASSIPARSPRSSSSRRSRRAPSRVATVRLQRRRLRSQARGARRDEGLRLPTLAARHAVGLLQRCHTSAAVAQAPGRDSRWRRSSPESRSMIAATVALTYTSSATNVLGSRRPARSADIQSLRFAAWPGRSDEPIRRRGSLILHWKGPIRAGRRSASHHICRSTGDLRERSASRLREPALRRDSHGVRIDRPKPGERRGVIVHSGRRPR